MSTQVNIKQTYACHIDSLLDRFLQHAQTHYPQITQLGDDIYSKFSYLVASMPTGLTRDDHPIHIIMLKILNSIQDWRRHSPLANHRLTSLWGWPGDDLTYEFDQISVDISFNFNRMNKVQWHIKAVQSALQEESSESESLSAASASSDDEQEQKLNQSNHDQNPLTESTSLSPPDQSPTIHSQSESDDDEPLDMDSISPRVSLDPSKLSLPVQGMGISK